MIAKLAFLTSPAPNRFILNFQNDDEVGTPFQFEISKAHLANILIDGTALVLRDNTKSDRLNEAVGTIATAGEKV